MDNKLYRDETNKKIAGVCAGLAQHFGIDVSTMRVIFIISLFLHGIGGLVYVILWIVLPGKMYNPRHPFVDYRVPPQSQNFSDYGVPDMPPVMPQPVKKGGSSGAVIAGAVLVVIGVFFLLHTFHILTAWHFRHLWPLSLVAIGLMFVLASIKKEPWEKRDWQQTDAANEQVKEEPAGQDNSSNINPPTE